LVEGLVEPAAKAIERLARSATVVCSQASSNQFGEVAAPLPARPGSRRLRRPPQFEHVDLLVEQPQHLLLDGAAGDQIEDEHLAGLADAIDTAIRCSMAMGFHGISKLISVLQNWILRPSPPDSVHSRTGTRSRKIGDRGVLVGAAEAAFEAGERDAVRVSKSARLARSPGGG